MNPPSMKIVNTARTPCSVGDATHRDSRQLRRQRIGRQMKASDDTERMQAT